MSNASATLSKAPVGFIGLGNMGSRMTRCLVQAGIPVLGFDLDGDAARRSGATPASSPSAVAEASELVLLSLPGRQAVESVMYGPAGVVGCSRPGQVVVDLSTSSPDSTRSIHTSLLERDAHYLDAGISGGAAAAEKGALTLMVGGEEVVLERARPVLEVFSAQIYYLGASGAGHTAKLLNNFLNAVSLAATAEVMVAAKKAELDLTTLLDVINNSSGVNFATQHRFPKIVTGDYLKGGLTNRLMMKDVILYAELASRLGVSSPNAAGPLAAFGLAIGLGYGDEISNTVVDALGDISGGIRLHDGKDD